MTPAEDTRTFRWQIESGERVVVGDAALTPQSHALTIRLPFGGWVWNRPIAVLVERNGQEERIPIVDATRIAQLTLLGFTMLFSIVVWWQSLRIRRNQNA